MGVVPPKYVSFRAVLTISNRTSFTYRRNFPLKLSVQHSENISPFYFLNVPISGFLPFSKAAKWSSRSWWGFQHLGINDSIYSSLQFGSAWSGWTAIMKYKKRPDCLWVAVIGSLVFITFPSSSWRTESFKVKTACSDVSMVWPRKSKSLRSLFSTWVFTGLPCQQNGRTELQSLWHNLLLLLK